MDNLANFLNDGIDTWLDMVSHSLFRSLSTNADQLYIEIRDIRESLKQNISGLRDAEPNENMPDHIIKIVIVQYLVV